MISAVLTPTVAAVARQLYRLSVEQYHAMIGRGILKSGEPIELLEGVLVRKMTINPPQTFAIEYLRDLLAGMMPVGWFVNAQQPITTSDSEPGPDVALYRGDRRTFLLQDRHPGAGDAELLVGVADSSLPDDRTVKGRIYARAGVPLYWIVNLVDRQLEVYTDPVAGPGAPSYRQRHDFHPGDAIPIVLGGREAGRVAVAELFV